MAAASVRPGGWQPYGVRGPDVHVNYLEHNDEKTLVERVRELQICINLMTTSTNPALLAISKEFNHIDQEFSRRACKLGKT